MSDQAHIIEIDCIVLNGVDLHNPRRLGALIEAQVQRKLSGSDMRTSASVAPNETRVAGEVARAVVQSLPGGNSRE